MIVFRSLLRYDKYEKKHKYWYEEDLEMEWEKQKVKATTQEGEYEIEGNLGDFAMEHSAPLAPDMNVAAEGS